jgi:hypothetical protein
LVGAAVEVLGDAGIVMFGMVAATGVRILGGVDFRNNRNNLFIAAIAVGFGLIPPVAPTFFHNFYPALKPILDSGVILTTIVAVIYSNGLGSQAAAGGPIGRRRPRRRSLRRTGGTYPDRGRDLATRWQPARRRPICRNHVGSAILRPLIAFILKPTRYRCLHPNRPPQLPSPTRPSPFQNRRGWPAAPRLQTFAWTMA